MSEAILRTVLEAVSDAIIIVGRDRSFFPANSSAARLLFGHSQDPLSGCPIDAVFPDPGFIALVDEMLETNLGEPVRTEVAFPEKRTGETRAYQVTLVPLVEGSEQDKRVIAILRDRAGQEEPDRGTPHFLSIVSHEFKTPLHSMSGMVQLLLEGKTGPLNDLQRDFLNTVKDQTNRLQMLVQELLEFGRLGAARFTVHPEPVDVGVLASNTLRQLGPIAAAAQVDLDNRIPLHCHTVEADPMRIEQVLANLCENAIRFTESGGRVTVGANDRGAEVEVYVADTGTGICPEDLPLIFTPFYQGDHARAGRGANVGLGLYIAKQIIEAHGGRIWVESVLTEGSTFYFTLPKTSR